MLSPTQKTVQHLQEQNYFPAVNIADVHSSNENSDSSSLDEEYETQAFYKKVKTEKESSKAYTSLEHSEIFLISNWVKNNLWRRTKFLSDKQISEQVYACLRSILPKLDKATIDTKYFDTVQLINKNLSSKRAYAKKKVTYYLIGK